MALGLAPQGFVTEVAQSILSDPQFTGTAPETVAIPAREHEGKHQAKSSAPHKGEKTL